MKKNCRERALALLAVGQKADIPEIKARAVAVGQIWITFAGLDEQLTMWARQAESEIS